MTQLQNPQRGQPLDIDYIYQMVQQINTLSTKVLSQSTVLSTINNGVNETQEFTTNNLRFYAFTKNVKSGTVNAGEEVSWTIDFTPNFLLTPVVTATARNRKNDAIGNFAYAVITNVNTAQVQGRVIFNKAGTVDVNVNIIAIGTT